jgi:hypothetical protein
MLDGRTTSSAAPIKIWGESDRQLGELMNWYIEVWKKYAVFGGSD